MGHEGITSTLLPTSARTHQGPPSHCVLCVLPMNTMYHGPDSILNPRQIGTHLCMSTIASSTL